MVRTREFDTDEALSKALKVFWQRGYQGTTIRDISAGTGVAHAGIYSAFKNKDALFYRTLRKYAAEQTSYLFGPLEQPDAALSEIKTFFDRVVGGAKSGSFSNGCFLANTAAEFRGENEEIGDLLNDAHSRQVRAFANAIENAKAKEEIGSEIKVGDMASMLVALFYGMSALARTGPSHRELRRIANSALSALG